MTFGSRMPFGDSISECDEWPMNGTLLTGFATKLDSFPIHFYVVHQSIHYYEESTGGSGTA